MSWPDPVRCFTFFKMGVIVFVVYSKYVIVRSIFSTYFRVLEIKTVESLKAKRLLALFVS